MFSPKRGCRWPALAAGRNQLTNATLAALFVPADTQRVKKAPGVPGLEVTKHLARIIHGGVDFLEVSGD